MSLDDVLRRQELVRDAQLRAQLLLGGRLGELAELGVQDMMEHRLGHDLRRSSRICHVTAQDVRQGLGASEYQVACPILKGRVGYGCMKVQ